MSGTITNQAGEYRFMLSGLGRYSVFANDARAGYSMFGTGHASGVVELTPEHPEAELRVELPPKAGFLVVHLTDRTTGTVISLVRAKVMLAERADSPLFEETLNTAACEAWNPECAFLIPPDKQLLVHVSSEGFQEWDESVGKGKVLLLPSGARLTWDIKLDPLRP
jgi:hypothetical protein